MKRGKNAVAFLLTAVCLAALSACGRSAKTYPSEDYVLELPYSENFRVLVLSDVHLADKDNRWVHYDFMDLTISEANADLIAVDGDLFTFADKATAKDFFAFLDNYGIPWTVTFGNHDEQAYFSVDWLTDYLNHYGSNCVFLDLKDDDVFGYANFSIHLMEDGMVREQIIVMDSNRYNFGDYYGYDYIRPSQIDWYERIIKDTAAKEGKTVPSLLLFHIPLPEYDDAWNAVQEGNPDAELIYGEKRENCCPPLYNSGLFEKVLALDSTRGICTGHDHVNNFCIKYKGVYLSYCLHATNRIYGDEDLQGGLVITIRPDGDLSFEPIFHTYDEVS